MIICKQEYFYILENNEFLHFAKVLLVHSSKDKASVDWWENENKTKDDSIPKVYINNLTMSARLENYRKFVKNLPKMQIETASIPFHEFKNISVTQNIGRTQTKVRKEGNF